MPIELGNWTAVDVAVVALAAVAVLAALTPVVASCLGWTILRFIPVEDPDAARPEDPDADFERIYRALTGLGFEPVGLVRETARLFGPHWYRESHIYCLRSRDGSTYASVYRIIDGERWRLTLKTITDAGGMVSTAAPGVGLESNDGWCSRREFPDTSPAELVECHAGHLRAFLAATDARVAKVSLAERAAVDEEFDRRQLKEMGGASHFTWIGLCLALPAYLAGCALDFLAPELSEPTLYGAATILGCVTYFLFIRFGLPLVVAAAAAEQNPS